jgi:hypothetical protein
MIERRTIIIVSLMALLLLGVSGGVILAQWPHHGWAWMFTHEPRPAIVYLFYWLGLPLNVAAVLLVFLTIAFFRRGKPVSPGRRLFLSRGVIGFGLLSIIIEVVRVGGLFAYRAQRAAHLAAGGGAHTFHFDPQFILTRVCLVASGLFVVWLGNRLPKLITPRSDRPDRPDSAPVRRFGGWLFVIAGLGMVTCAFLTSIQTALAIDLAIAISSLLIWIGASCAYRLGRPPSHTTSKS